MWLALLLSAATLNAPLFPDDLPRGIGSWDPKTLGNHRIVVEVPEMDTSRPPVVRVHIPWRRRDKHPELIDTVVTDAKGTLVSEVYRKTINREFGDLAFAARTGSGTYYVYHLPHVTHGSYYPSVTYTKPVPISDTDRIIAKWDQLPEAKAVRFESISVQDAFTPMEVIATHAEVERILAAHPDDGYLVFPEDRHLSVRMWDDLPYRWVAEGANIPFQGKARRGEYFTFQLGVWAARISLSDAHVEFSPLKSDAGQVISANGFTCYNTTGVDYKGYPFTIEVNVAKGKVQPLWCGVDIPSHTKPGVYHGVATVSAKGAEPTAIPITLTVENTVVQDHGDDVPGDMTRLRWLNSTLGQDHTIVKPFKEDGPLDSEISIGGNGFFSQVARSISSRMDRTTHPPVKLLASPIDLKVTTEQGAVPESVVTKPDKKRVGKDGFAWSQESQIGPLVKRLKGSLAFDGTAEFQVELQSMADCDLADIALELPLRKEVGRYLMGLGREGGYAPEQLDWKWNVANNQEGAWVGAVNCGVLFSLRDDRYVRPLNTNFYREKPLIMPISWDNHGKGGIHIRTEGDTYRITCYSGPRTMKKGETLHFNIHMLLTPMKLIDPAKQFSERYYHAFKPLDEIEKDGANVVNVHHATPINPWINYPFLGFTDRTPGHEGPSAQMKDYIDAAHAQGIKVKIYDTIRELTTRTPELFMLKSLGHEVFSAGKGGGGSWLREHMDDDYISAWHATEVGDAAIVNSGMSRWHNYYVEGLDWLARKVGIDGLYLDDVAFDRVTMLRVRRVLERRISERSPLPTQPGQAPIPNVPLIDLHSANQHDANDGWNNSALLYMDLMPFLDRLWFGEEFNYDKSPDYWLVEMSGLPYGLMGEMLQNGGNPWRGMLFGMTARRPWSGDPRPLWHAWDEFGIREAELIGWWADDCPVKTSDKDVLATAYVRRANHTALLSIASWAKDPVSVQLHLDWKALGIDPRRATLVAKPIDKFQAGQTFRVGDPIPVEPGKGWLITVSEG